MKVSKSLILSVNILLTHKVRTVLALIGVSIGIASVMIMVSIGKGAQNEAIARIQELGKNLLFVKAKKVERMVGRNIQSGMAITLSQKDAEVIIENIAEVEYAVPAYEIPRQIKYGNTATGGRVLGTTPEFSMVRNFPAVKGRYFTDEENRAGRRVAVIGNDIVKYLFEDEDPVGATIRIGKISFKVIGILLSKGVVQGANEDDLIIIPLRTALRRVINSNYIQQIYVQVREENLIDLVEKNIEQLLRETHGLNRSQKDNDFDILSQINVIETARETSGSFTLLTTTVAGISLLVGGIGILAIMLLSIKERTSEIGLRMAVGARPRDIMYQFLFESLFLGFAGGILGILTGLSGIWIVKNFTVWDSTLPREVILLSLSVSLLIGLIFGVIPAYKASKLDPNIALQSE